jgi:hypothetical protein
LDVARPRYELAALVFAPEHVFVPRPAEIADRLAAALSYEAALQRTQALDLCVRKAVLLGEDAGEFAHLIMELLTQFEPRPEAGQYLPSPAMVGFVVSLGHAPASTSQFDAIELHCSPDVAG